MTDPTIATCPFIVTRGWEQDACEKPAVCVITYEWDGGTFHDPACAYHAHMHGAGAGIPITQAEADAIAARGGA